MYTYNNLYAKELLKLIDEEIGRLVDQLSVGASIENIAQYKLIVGQIVGLKKIIELNEEVESILAKK